MLMLIFLENSMSFETCIQLPFHVKIHVTDRARKASAVFINSADSCAMTAERSTTGCGGVVWR